MKMVNLSIFTVFLKNRNFISKIRISKVTDYAALSGHSKIDKTKVLKTNGSLMKVESIAECSKRAFCNSFDLHQGIISLEKQFLVFFLSGRLRLLLLYILASCKLSHSMLL